MDEGFAVFGGGEFLLDRQAEFGAAELGAEESVSAWSTAELDS